MDEARPTVVDCVNFLARLHCAGSGYSSVNAARSALSAAVSIAGTGPVGEHPLVRRLLRGVYLRAPPTPRYACVWDVNVVLDMIRSSACVADLGLKMLSFFTVTLLLIVSGQRCQTLAKLDLGQSVVSGEMVALRVTGLLKTSRPGARGDDIVVRAFPAEPRVCVVRMLAEYIRRTARLRAGSARDALFVSYAPPHGAVSSATIGRWAKRTLAMAGVSTEFGAHSTRAAAASAAKSVMPVDQLVKGIGWASARTFARFYDKRVCERGEVADAILNRYVAR